MAKQPELKNKVKKVILDYLDSPENTEHAKSQLSLAEYARTQLHHERITVSIANCRKAVSELIDDNKIKKDGRKFVIVYTDEEFLKRHPILNFSDQVQVKLLPIESFLAIRVQKNYANAICDFLNSKFDDDDIQCLVLDDMIICMQFVLPDDSELEEKADLYSRIEKCLGGFELKSLSVPPNKIEGYTAEDLWEQDEEIERKREREEDIRSGRIPAKGVVPRTKHFKIGKINEFPIKIKVSPLIKK